MDFMKVFDQTVREIKREVNLKVLKIPEIEQKVLDATDNEPWGPHGSALAEIAQATKKFSECQIVMNTLWARLSETGKDWRYVYKALTVIEYLIANGSERAVDDIIEHTYRIASLSGFEYVEPSGKDMGINVRKKVETIVALLNDKDKIQEARNKAAKTRDKYFGLSSTGITNKSSSSLGSSSYGSSNHNGGQYGGFSGTQRGDSFDSRKNVREQTGEGKYERGMSKSSRVVAVENQVKSPKRGSKHYGSKDHDKVSSSVPKSSMGSKHSHSSSLPSSKYDDNFDDFDPRGTSAVANPTVRSSSEIDLFANFMDEPGPVAPKPKAPDADNHDVAPDIDLFQDAAFLSASPTKSVPHDEVKVDLFASQPAALPASSSTVDLFDDPDATATLEPKESSSTANPTTNYPFAPASAKPEHKELTSPANPVVDPFASVPLSNFDGADLFGTSSSPSDSKPKDISEQCTNYRGPNNIGGKSLAESNLLGNKNSFQVKSGIWADSLSRGLIDLNISAPKKVNLADVGVVGDLDDGSNAKDKVVQHSFYMGSAMGSGSGLNRSSFSSSSSLNNAADDDFFSSLSGFKK